jgi:CRP/FNR family cyclic AMP-dependent transcriptional regulator
MIRPRELKQIPMFAKLDRDDLKVVAELVERVEYPAGHQICRQGQLGRTAYFIESGELHILHINPQGVEQEVGRKGPGDYFGETSLLLGEPRDATVEVVEAASLLYINKDAFDQLLRERPAVLKALQLSPEVKRKLYAPRFKWQDPDEVVVVSLRKHDVILIRQLILPALMLWLGLMGCIYWIQHPGAVLALVVGVILILVPLPVILYMTIDYRNDNYVVTNKRVVDEERVPLIRESRAEAPLRTIQDIQQTQEGLLASIFHFGSLIIETAGERGQVVFREIPNPAETRDAIFEQIRRVQALARAEERTAIREAMQRHFGIQPSEEQAPAPTPPPEKKRRLKLTVPPWVTAPLHIFTYLLPPLRQEQGDTITWRKHWIMLVKTAWLPTLVIAAATVTTILVLYLFHLDNWTPVLIGYGTVMIFLLPWWIWRFDDWQNDVYQVTATRIIDIERRPFFLREERREASLDNVQDTSLEIPGVLGKLLNFGSVTIETAGAAPFTFEFVKDPRGVQAEINHRVEAYQRRLRQQEAERRRAELLDWFSVYDQMRPQKPPAAPSPSLPQQES